MSPKETWVIYNKFMKEILWVSSEHFLAQRRLDELIQEPPEDGLVSNANKLVVCTLSRAILEIHQEHQAEKEYLKEEYEQVSRWATT